MDRLTKFKNIQNEGFELFKLKNQDYGSAYDDYGVIGILVRINDKIRRLQNITNNQILLIHDVENLNVKSETLRDTLIDLQNYSTMALMLLDEIKYKKI